MNSSVDLFQEDIELLRDALDNVRSYVYVKDRNSCYIYGNKQTLARFDCTGEELLNAKDSDFFPEDTVKKLREIDKRVLAGESTSEEITILNPDGTYCYFLEAKTPMYSKYSPNEVSYILGISTDITKQKELEQHAIELANTDPLTNVANRMKLDAVLENEIERAKRYDRPFSIILVDVDHFKAINDNHGHLVGDESLVLTSAIMSDNLRDIDVVGRWGGEEFLAICPETNLTGAIEAAEKLRKTIEKTPYPTIGHITASCGVATFTAGDCPITLLQRADKALYKAKKAGRNNTQSQ